MEGIFVFGDISYGTSQRNLLNADEILRLAPGKEILILRGQKPLLLDKMDYAAHPLAKRLRPQQGYSPSLWTAPEAADPIAGEPNSSEELITGTEPPSEEKFW